MLYILASCTIYPTQICTRNYFKNQSNTLFFCSILFCMHERNLLKVPLRWINKYLLEFVIKTAWKLQSQQSLAKNFWSLSYICAIINEQIVVFCFMVKCWKFEEVWRLFLIQFHLISWYLKIIIIIIQFTCKTAFSSFYLLKIIS